MQRVVSCIYLILGLLISFSGAALAKDCPPHLGIDPDTGRCRTAEAPGATLRVSAQPADAVVFKIGRPPTELASRASAPWADAWAACPRGPKDEPGGNTKRLGPANDSQLRGLSRGPNYLCVVAEGHVPELIRVDVQSADPIRWPAIELKALPRVQIVQRERCEHPKPTEWGLQVRRRANDELASQRLDGTQAGMLEPGKFAELIVKSNGYDAHHETSVILEPGQLRVVEACLVPQHRLSIVFDSLATNLDITLTGPHQQVKFVSQATAQSLRLLPGEYLISASVGQAVLPIGLTDEHPNHKGKLVNELNFPEDRAVQWAIKLHVEGFEKEQPSKGDEHGKSSKQKAGVLAPIVRMRLAPGEEALPELSAVAEACETNAKGEQSPGELCANAAYLASKGARESSTFSLNPLKSREPGRSWQRFALLGCKKGSARACAALAPEDLDERKGSDPLRCDREAQRYGRYDWLGCWRTKHRQTPVFSYSEEHLFTSDESAEWNEQKVVPFLGTLFGLGHGRPLSFHLGAIGVVPFDEGDNPFGVTFRLAHAVDVLPVRDATGEVSSHYVGVGLLAGLGLYWWPLEALRLDVGIDASRYYNGSGAPLGLSSSVALLPGSVHISIVGALRRLPDLTRNVAGNSETSMAGELVPLVGLNLGYELEN